jgi:hypothetical protein
MNKDGRYSINYLNVNSEGRGEAYVYNFGTDNKSLIIIPILATKISGFNGLEPTYSFSLTFSANERTSEEEAVLIGNLLKQIEQLKQEIARLQVQSSGPKTAIISCSRINSQLYFGLKNNNEVKCLQEFLRAQGAGVYPEAIVSGNYLTLTVKAVSRFQEKYRSEILQPIGLISGSGYVGQMTLVVINRLLTNP